MGGALRVSGIAWILFESVQKQRTSDADFTRLVPAASPGFAHSGPSCPSKLASAGLASVSASSHLHTLSVIREGGDPVTLLLSLSLSLPELLLLLLLLKQTAHATRTGHPEGAAHGWAAFSDRGRMPSRKMATNL